MPAHARRPKPSPPRLIETYDDIDAGIRSLRRKCPYLKTAHDLTGDPPLRRREQGFSGLARIVVAQQLSVASAAAIWTRTANACAPFTPTTLLAIDNDALRALGLSRPKIRTLRNIATALQSGNLDLDAFANISDEEIERRLTQVSGIGPWTAHIYIMFCLGRADAFAPGDLALRLAAGKLMRYDDAPTAEELSKLARRWQPWRGVAARLLWAYYAAVKSTDRATPL